MKSRVQGREDERMAWPTCPQHAGVPRRCVAIPVAKDEAVVWFYCDGAGWHVPEKRSAT